MFSFFITDTCSESFYKGDNYSFFKKLWFSMYFVVLKWGKPMPGMQHLLAAPPLPMDLFVQVSPALTSLHPPSSPWDSCIFHLLNLLESLQSILHEQPEESFKTIHWSMCCCLKSFNRFPILFKSHSWPWPGRCSVDLDLQAHVRPASLLH